MGVQCLYRSLRAVKSKHPLIVMHTDTLSPETAAALRTEGCIMRKVKPYFPPVSAAVDHSKYKNQCYADCWTKLIMWEMEEYDYLVYLDADMLVAKNIDHLFHLPTMAVQQRQQEQKRQKKQLFHSLEHSNGVNPVIWAVPDCAAGRPTEEERAQCSLLPQNIKNIKIWKQKESGSLHHSSTCSYSYFNAGMFICRPSIAQFQDFHLALSTGTYPIEGYAEQDFLNAYFQDSWHPLPTLFNLQKGIKGHHPELWVPEKAFIIHYTDCKPWHGRDHPDNQEYSDIVNWWWRVYTNSENDLSL